MGRDRSRAWGRGWGTLERVVLGSAAVALVTLAPSTAQAACASDKDCPGNDICEAGVCKPIPAAPLAAGASSQDRLMGDAAHADGRASGNTSESGNPKGRVGLALHVQPNLVGTRLGFGREAALALGLEWSPALGQRGRYHLMFGWAKFNILNGIRLEPLTFGIAIPIYENNGLRVEIEPQFALWQLQSYFDRGGVALFMSSGMGAHANFAYGPVFASVSPIGFDVRYFGFVSSGGRNEGIAEGAIDWRLRLSVGFQY